MKKDRIEQLKPKIEEIKKLIIKMLKNIYDIELHSIDSIYKPHKNWFDIYVHYINTEIDIYTKINVLVDYLEDIDDLNKMCELLSKQVYYSIKIYEEKNKRGDKNERRN